LPGSAWLFLLGFARVIVTQTVGESKKFLGG
jgi:hypothetical protein